MAEQWINYLFGQDRDQLLITITITVEEKLDRRGEEDKADFDTGGGAGDLFVYKKEQCSNTLGDFEPHQLG